MTDPAWDAAIRSLRGKNADSLALGVLRQTFRRQGGSLTDAQFQSLCTLLYNEFVHNRATFETFVSTAGGTVLQEITPLTQMFRMFVKSHPDKQKQAERMGCVYKALTASRAAPATAARIIETLCARLGIPFRLAGNLRGVEPSSTSISAKNGGVAIRVHSSLRVAA